MADNNHANIDFLVGKTIAKAVVFDYDEYHERDAKQIAFLFTDGTFAKAEAQSVGDDHEVRIEVSSGNDRMAHTMFALGMITDKELQKTVKQRHMARLVESRQQNERCAADIKIQIESLEKEITARSNPRISWRHAPEAQGVINDFRRKTYNLKDSLIRLMEDIARQMQYESELQRELDQLETKSS